MSYSNWGERKTSAGVPRWPFSSLSFDFQGGQLGLVHLAQVSESTGAAWAPPLPHITLGRRCPGSGFPPRPAAAQLPGWLHLTLRDREWRAGAGGPCFFCVGDTGVCQKREAAEATEERTRGSAAGPAQVCTGTVRCRLPGDWPGEGLSEPKGGGSYSCRLAEELKCMVLCQPALSRQEKISRALRPPQLADLDTGRTEPASERPAAVRLQRGRTEAPSSASPGGSPRARDAGGPARRLARVPGESSLPGEMGAIPGARGPPAGKTSSGSESQVVFPAAPEALAGSGGQ
ncbi:uncharacterized protein LOC114052240 [Vombatus ursinus]|uniref:uncharacterized protein LOC114052240 n=1 Tax=Vombatus ursinus TaxID=29139 RepID=UPI000FFD92FB|nr:uncharacterized protein LOC114052240 [Vombatus ursinus]XP_027730551.1 uncharacterized protein LOC114052240 [Vombatus ursinus]